MHHRRIAPWTIMLALVATSLLLPASVAAATAPTLKSPAASVGPLTEGKSMTFEWNGELQGEAAAINRSFFRVELTKASAMPAGVQSEWTEVENFMQTEPGSATTTAVLGVPTPGEYRWRVCAWGVVDALAANEIQQLPGGCSSARPITSVAASATKATPGELRMEERKQVAGATRTVYVPNPNRTQPAPVQPQPQVTAPVPAAPVEEPAPTRFQEGGSTSIEAGKGSALGLGSETLSSDPAARRTSGVAGAVVSGLGSNIPFVPIPFWTLALLLACIPILHVWRRSVLGMFDWDDGSIDGRGTFDNSQADLELVPVASEVKNSSMTADGAATAPAPDAHPDAPDRRRHAA